MLHETQIRSRYAWEGDRIRVWGVAGDAASRNEGVAVGVTVLRSIIAASRSEGAAVARCYINTRQALAGDAVKCCSWSDGAAAIARLTAARVRALSPLFANCSFRVLRETDRRDVRFAFQDRDMRCWQRYNARERDRAFCFGVNAFKRHEGRGSSLPSTERDPEAREGKKDAAGQIL